MLPPGRFSNLRCNASPWLRELSVISANLPLVHQPQRTMLLACLSVLMPYNLKSHQKPAWSLSRAIIELPWLRSHVIFYWEMFCVEALPAGLLLPDECLPFAAVVPCNWERGAVPLVRAPVVALLQAMRRCWRGTAKCGALGKISASLCVSKR